MPADMTPIGALIVVAFGVLFGLGFHLASVVVEALKSGTASVGAVICIVLAVVFVILAIVL